jgi:hypothetical protein
VTDSRIAQFRELLNKRECAAFQVVGVAQNALAYLNFGDIEKAKTILMGAVADYQVADQAIDQFYKKSVQGERDNGNTKHSAA